MALAVRNGQINLRTGELEPHNRASFITKLIDVDYDPHAPRPRWNAFVRQVSDGDDEVAGFLQRVAGYSLTGSCKEQCLFVYYGHGANGKSTMLETLKELFGPYAMKTPMSTFLSVKGERPSNDLARMRGTRLVTSAEVGHSDRLNEPLLKELTGGDTVTARFLFKEFFGYRPAFKIIMSVNDLPRIEAGDAAINRRLHVVPFTATFAAADCDKDLPEKLKEEMPGILAWVVEGCLAWQREGLNPPRAVKSATERYIGTNDMLGEFIKEHCTLGDGYVSAKDFFIHYYKWLKETYGEETNKVALGRLMRKKGFSSKPRNGERIYDGVTYNHPRV
jgi:putative DNA primase/helicase